MNGFRLSIASGAACAALLVAGSASALEEPFTQGVSVSGGMGYGAWLGEGDHNAYGFGMNVRGGYTFDFNLYLGARFDFHFGTREPYGPIDIHAHTWMFQGEVGYDLGITPIFVIRPKMGLGPQELRARVVDCDNCDPDSDVGLGIALGVEAPIELGPVFLSPETRFNFYTGDADATAFLFGLNVGAAF